MVRTVIGGLDRTAFDLHVCSARPLLAEDHLDQVGTGITFSSLELVGNPSVARRLKASLKLASIVRAWDPDIVHTHSGVAWYLLPWVASNRARTRTILEVHDSPQSLRVSAKNNRVERSMLRRLGVLPLVHSASVAADLATATGIPMARIPSIPIGIDTSRFQARVDRSWWRASVGISEDEIVISYVARLAESKNPLLFVRVASAVAPLRPKVRFVLVGNGTEREAVAALAAKMELGPRLVILTHVEDVSVPLGASDIFLSTSDYEGFGIAVLEAMAAGLPVVTTAAGGVQELVMPKETGMITPVAQEQPIVDAILQLVDNPEERQDMGVRARERAIRLFDRKSMVRAYEEFYRSLSSSIDLKTQRGRNESG